MPSIDAEPQRKETICEVHRCMYRIIKERDQNDPLIPLLRKAFYMAKKLRNTAIRYKHRYDEAWFEDHKLDGGELEDAGSEGIERGTI